jgi:Protein of unknown function (DUF2878)
MSATLGNFLGYQIVWFSAVYGAAGGLAWPGVATALLFAIVQLALSRVRTADVLLMATAILVGSVLDGGLAYTTLVRYAAPWPALPPGGAPLWILALWGAFALTLNHSLGCLRSRTYAAMALGAIGGPLAYAAAARVQAVVFATPVWRPILILATGWALVLALLTLLAASAAAGGATADTRRHSA